MSRLVVYMPEDMINSSASDNVRNKLLFTGELAMACYACVYLRYVRDGSLMLAVFALILISLSDFIKSLMLAYLKRNQWSAGNSGPANEAEVDDDSDVSEILDDAAIKAILLRALKYFQIIILTQTIYSFSYHFCLKLDEKFCQNRFGFTTLLLLGELDCSERGKWFVWFLDVLIILFELIIVTNSLRSDSRNKSLSITQLQVQKHGILSILLLNLWSEDLAVDGGLDLCIVPRPHAGNPNYGSTSDGQTIEEEDTVSGDEMGGLLP